MFSGFSVHEDTIVDTKNLSFKEALPVVEGKLPISDLKIIAYAPCFFAVFDQVMKRFRFFVAFEANGTRHQVSQSHLFSICDASHQKTINIFFGKQAKIPGFITFGRKVSSFLSSCPICEPIQKVYLSLLFGYKIPPGSYKYLWFSYLRGFLFRSLLA